MDPVWYDWWSPTGLRTEKCKWLLFIFLCWSRTWETVLGRPKTLHHACVLGLCEHLVVAKAGAQEYRKLFQCCLLMAVFAFAMHTVVIRCAL